MQNKEANLDLNLASYDYELNPDFIAKYPKEPAKLLVYDIKKDEYFIKSMLDLPQILPECEIFFNDTKVIKARLYGRKKSGALREIFIHKVLFNSVLAQIKGRVKQGDEIFFQEGFKASILGKEGELYTLQMQKDKPLLQSEVYALLNAQGHVPLPPYIKRKDTKSDESDYQSIFAAKEGAIAAPTASLHFDAKLIAKLKQNHALHTLTLHVGAGTFKGVECANILKHKMHEEYFEIKPKDALVIDSKVPILSVGTTVTRTIEYYVRTKMLSGECDLFLHPKSLPKRINHLLTNFHLPKSTLIMLVASFIGREKTLKLYEIAKKEGFRFYSYGDAMLLLNYQNKEEN